MEIIRTSKEIDEKIVMLSENEDNFCYISQDDESIYEDSKTSKTLKNFVTWLTIPDENK